jgi:hypothetical protein
MDAKMIVLVIVVFLAASGCSSSQTASGRNLQAQDSISPVMQFEEKISAGEVAIALTPEYSGGILKVGYSINTHSVDLSRISLQEQVSLGMGGKEVKPSNSPLLSGHHNSGTLEFSVDNISLPFEIIIKDIPEVKLRKISWE